MLRKMIVVIVTSLALGACATSGTTFSVDANNSPSQCRDRMTQAQIPPAQLHDYMQRCTAGYDAAHQDDSGSTFTLPSQKDQNGQ